MQDFFDDFQRKCPSCIPCCCPPHPHPHPRPDRCGCVPKPCESDCCSFVRVDCEGKYELAPVHIDNGPLTTADYGFAASNMNPRDIDPVGMQSSSGMLYFSRIELSCPVTINRMFVGVSSPGIDLTAGGSFLGIYSASGNLLVQTADQSAAWETAGVYTIPVTAISLSEGRYYLALLSNGSTTPEFAASQAGSLALNITLSPPDLAYGQLPDQAALPAAVDPGMFTIPPIGQKMPWIAISYSL